MDAKKFSLASLTWWSTKENASRDLFGTTAWKASYSRRVAIESTNAEARNHRADINRGYTRVFGLTATSLLLAFGLAGLNVRILHDWRRAT